MNDEDAVRLGQEAQIVLGNKAYQYAFDAVERALVNVLAEANIDPAEAERTRLMLSLGRKYRRVLERAMQEGRFVAESLRDK